MNEFIKGADISTILEVEACGGHFYREDGSESDLITILSEYGFNYVRLRLWNNPFDPDGVSFGAGTCDLKTVITIAARAKKAGMKFLLDFHYSDFWADPGKQRKPRAWADHNADQLTKDVYDFTYKTFSDMAEADVYPDMVQIGNELSAGLLWPEGQWPNFENMARFVSSGILAVRDADKKYGRHTLTMIHLDNGGKNELYRTWFDNYFKTGEDFDIIGLSYYPFWHGSLEALTNNMKDISERYRKDLVIAEVSMGFSMEDYSKFEDLTEEQRKGYATKAELVAKVPFPMTPKGQSDFMSALLEVLRSIPNSRGIGFFWWEAGWLPVPKSGWATEAAIEYMNEKGPGGNEWANQTLFDYSGHPLPALNTIKNFEV